RGNFIANFSSQFSLDFLDQEFGLADGIACGRDGSRGTPAIPITQAAGSEDGGGHHDGLLLYLFLLIFHGNSPGRTGGIEEEAGSGDSSTLPLWASGVDSCCSGCYNRKAGA